MTTSELTNLADRHQERADRLAECSRQTAFRDSAADLIADAELHAETAAALREAGRPRTATFENTERDRLAWRDRAWKAESELDAALAEVERLRDGIRDHKHDALCNGPLFARERIEALWGLLDTPEDTK